MSSEVTNILSCISKGLMKVACVYKLKHGHQYINLDTGDLVIKTTESNNIVIKTKHKSKLMEIMTIMLKLVI